MAWESLQTLGSYTLATYNGTIPTRQDYVNPANCTVGNTPLCTSVTDNPDFNHYVFNIGTDYFIDYKFKSSQQNFIDTTFITQVSGLGTYKVESCDLGFAVDHSIHEAKAMLFIYYKSSAQASTWCSLICPEGWSTTENRQALYTILTNYHEHEWQSVPSISGKNGILSLAQIKEEYINDGESVSGASADYFTNLSTGNRVDVLINDALPAPEIGGTTVTVKYTIPTLSIGSYAYCKLVAKKNSIPEGPEDGDKIIDIDPSLTSCTIRGLDELSQYYFVVFIEDELGNTATSEPMDCETGEKTTIDFFTDSFNSDLMKDGWNLSNIKGGWGSGNDGWNPSQYSDFFLSSWNFLMGNSGKKPIVLVDGTLRRSEYSTAAGDCIFWIPINRVNGELKGLEWDYCNIRPRGGSYDAIGIIIGWVDSNNGWHQYTVAWIDNLHDTNWHHGEYTNLSPQNTHIDYIGIYTCDGQPACKNIILTVL